MLNMTDYDPEAQFLKALTHPARLAIIAVLRRGEACVCHLESVLGYRQAFISQHLMVLRDAGIVQDRRVASNVFYNVCDKRAFSVLDALVSERHPTPTPTHPTCSCPNCARARAEATPAATRVPSTRRH